MADFYKGNIPILDCDKADIVGSAEADKFFPKGAAFGHDSSQYVPQMFAAPSSMELIPESEYDARYDEQEATKSSLEHIYLSGPGGAPAFTNLNQASEGYCWFYSSTHAVMIARLRDGAPLRILNAHSGAAIIKRGRNEGGWCGLSAKFIRDNGVAEMGTGPGQWPEHSRDLRYDTPECRASMKKYRSLEEWVDLASSVYDQNLTEKQLATQLFQNNPGPTDWNFWRHSVCALRWVRTEPGAWGILILNSWLNWGRHGLAVLRRKAPDGALTITSVVAA